MTATRKRRRGGGHNRHKPKRCSLPRHKHTCAVCSASFSLRRRWVIAGAAFCSRECREHDDTQRALLRVDDDDDDVLYVGRNIAAYGVTIDFSRMSIADAYQRVKYVTRQTRGGA